MSLSINKIIAQELNIKEQQIEATIKLLDDGNTVPFVARYRKEVTGGLDDTQLRQLDSRLTYLRELDARRQSILKSIDEQEKLTPELKQRILTTTNKTELEDLYLPYKQKRRTKAQIAIEAGLEPLARLLWKHPENDPETSAKNYLNAEKGIENEKIALDGARSILMEEFAQDAALLTQIRLYLKENAQLQACVVEGKETEGAKYKDYFAYNEAISKVPSHRALAMFRGRNEGFLQLSLNSDPNQEEGSKGSYCENIIMQHYDVDIAHQAADFWRKQVISWTWRIKILTHMETEFMSELKSAAEEEAIRVFADNLKDLLMAAPAGAKVTLGLDPGYRNGVKIAAVDDTGKLVDSAVIYPFPPQKKTEEAKQTLCHLIERHKIQLVAIGNGTASRETDTLMRELVKEKNLQLQSVVVSEAGASVYSASQLAADEFPDVDVSIRGAASIARRLQDPLAELVKIDPKSIGVGQYQHDVSQTLLAKRLNEVVEDCVNAVGVDVNTASAPLLTRVAGLNKTLAKNIVAHRDENGRFDNRTQLKKVTRLGPKAFEQCAGFLRITDGKNPLDASSVHPEAYPVVKKIAGHVHKDIRELIGNTSVLKTLNADDYTDNTFGRPTVVDIIEELNKPGRDPRPEFKTAVFAEGINEPKDLIPGMILQGVVSNVANFGAFVDIGVHQDALVHISALSDKFISDPRDIVKAGDVVKVKVMEIDLTRNRIGLSMRLDDDPKSAKTSERSGQQVSNRKKEKTSYKEKNYKQENFNNAFATAFANAKKK